MPVTVNFFSTKMVSHGSFCESESQHMRENWCTVGDLYLFSLYPYDKGPFLWNSELPHVCWLQVKFHQKAVMSEHWRNSNSLTCLSTCVPLSQNYNNQDFGDLASVVLIISFYILFLVSAWNTGNFRLQLMLFYHDKFVEWYEWNHQFVWMYWCLPFFIFFWISENVLSCYW